MGAFETIRDRLPMLYRPEDRDTSLLTRFLGETGRALDDLGSEAAVVLQAHWFSFADRALVSPWFARLRELQRQPLPAPDSHEVRTFPYIDDLARLASILTVLPRTNPPSQRDVVEEYRQRIA